MKTAVVKVTNESIVFDNGQTLSSYHQQDCCEHHYLSFEHLSEKDFEGLVFDLNGEFFEKVNGYGIRLLPISGGHPVSIPGYGFNNGYYSTYITLVLSGGDKETKKFDVTECQFIIKD